MWPKHVLALGETGPRAGAGAHLREVAALAVLRLAPDGGGTLMRAALAIAGPLLATLALLSVAGLLRATN